MNFDSLIPDNYIEREIEEKVFKFLKDRETIVIRGPRQSGKTTLLYKIGKILQKTYGDDQVVFVNFEDELEQIKFEKSPKEYLKFYLREKKKTFFLLDEFHYVKKGGKILKLLFDSYPQAKFIISGSSTLDITNLGAYLVGRAIFFELFPFSFVEFLKAKEKKVFLEYQTNKFSLYSPRKTDSIYLDRLNQFLKEYISFGGYPRVVMEKDDEKKKILLKNIFTTYIEKDIIKLYGIKYKEKAILTLKYLSARTGDLINFNDICQTVSLHFKELKELFSIFEETYILRKLSPYHKNLVTEIKKNPKIYFFDLGLRNALIDQFEFLEDGWGRLIENYVFLVYKDKPISFWRTTAKAEVDFVLKDKEIPIEVKMTPKVSRSLLSFIDAYKPKLAVVANWDRSKVIKKGQTKVFFSPLSLLK